VQNKNYHPSQVLERKKKLELKNHHPSQVLERKTKLELKNHHPSRVFESNRNQRLSHPSQAFEQIEIKDSIIHARRLKKKNQNQRIIIHPRRLKQIRLKKSESKIHLIWRFQTPERTVGSQETTCKEPHQSLGRGFRGSYLAFSKKLTEWSYEIRIGYLIFS